MKKNYETKLVSIAIPTFNRINYLKLALNSALEQDIENIEIIVSDNASTDGTREYLSGIDDERVIVLENNKNLGMVANWDRCLSAANGKYFILLSDDDQFLANNALRKLISAISEYDNYAFSFCGIDIQRVSRQKNEIKLIKKYSFDAKKLIELFFNKKITIVPAGTLFRTSDIKKLGGYKSFGANLAVDACLWMALIFKYGKAAYIPEPLVLYRVHDSLSSTSIENWDYEYKAIYNLLNQFKNQYNIEDLKKYVNFSREIIPFNYIIRKLRSKNKYPIQSIVNDVWIWRYKIFSISTLKFIFIKLKYKKFF